MKNLFRFLVLYTESFILSGMSEKKEKKKKKPKNLSAALNKI